METFFNNLFELAITALGVLSVMYFKDMKDDVKKMSASMIDMNIKLFTVITKHDNTEYVAKKNVDEIDSIRNRIHRIEGSHASQFELIKHLDKELTILKSSSQN